MVVVEREGEGNRSRGERVPCSSNTYGSGTVRKFELDLEKCFSWKTKREVNDRQIVYRHLSLPLQ